MSNVYQLMDACCEAYDKYRIKDTAAMTYCNQTVQMIAEKLGFKKFNMMLANQMIEYMRSHPAEWGKVELPEAQDLANRGFLLIAGQQAEPHGHVVVIRPGVAVHSAKWGCDAPKVINIGAENFIDKAVSWVFKDKPDVFLYKE